jgi:hypothetical protein
VVELLRDMSSADVNMEDGETDDESDIKSDKESIYRSFRLAAKDGDEAIIRLLLETGKTDVNAQDRNGRTRLCLAAQRDRCHC